MNSILKSGHWLFASMYAVFGLLHFGPSEFTLPYVPDFLPFPVFWVYFAGIALIAFSVSAWLGLLDQLAAVLLALMLLLFIVLIHIPTALEGKFLGVLGIFRDTANLGAALMYADKYARDRRYVGVFDNSSATVRRTPSKENVR